MMPGTDIGIQIQKLRDVHAKNFTHPLSYSLSSQSVLDLPLSKLMYNAGNLSESELVGNL